MPHKRAKRSIREKLRSEQGSDQAPFSKQSISSEPIPKTLSRVLNAAHVRQEWREKKRKLASGEDIIGEGPGKNKKRRVDVDTKDKKKVQASGIQPGESLAHFNRRVEDDMRPVVKSAIQSSSAQARRVKKSEIKAEGQPTSQSSSKRTRHTSPSPSPPPAAQSQHPARATEFQKMSTSAPRRLNDIAHAPPEFKNLPRGAEDKSKKKYGVGKEGVISMKQKIMMEEEREKAIVRYRALKERRRRVGGGGDSE